MPQVPNKQEGQSSESNREESVQMLRGPGSSDTMASRLTPLDQLIPDSTDSDTKMELIFQARNQFFDGRWDAASVCFVGHFGRGRAPLLA